MKICEYCDTQCEESVRICPSCGASDFSHQCANCGSVFRGGDYCPHCGLKVGTPAKKMSKLWSWILFHRLSRLWLYAQNTTTCLATISSIKNTVMGAGVDLYFSDSNGNTYPSEFQNDTTDKSSNCCRGLYSLVADFFLYCTPITFPGILLRVPSHEYIENLFCRHLKNIPVL